MPYLNIVWRIIIMRKRISSIVLTVVMILGCIITDMDVNINTVNADPYNIEISVETKEIGIEEIPQDRLVPLEVTLSNVPEGDYYYIDIAYRLNNKLYNRHGGIRPMDTIEALPCSVSYTDTTSFFVRTGTLPMISIDHKVSDGRIYNIYIFVPYEVVEGDFYEIIPIQECVSAESGNVHRTSFSFFTDKLYEDPNDYFEYGPENFSYHGGGLKIRSSQPEQPISNEPVLSAENPVSIHQNAEPEIQTQIINETTSTQASSISNSSVVSSTKITTSSAVTTEYTLPKTSIDEEKESTDIPTTNSIQEKNNGNNKIAFVIMFIIILLIIITLTIIIRKRKKK